MTRFIAAAERHGQPAVIFRCGTCGGAFTTKGEKRRHKQAGCTSPEPIQQSEPMTMDDAGKFGRPWLHITPEIKAQADAEWAAMDGRGQLPKGWREEYARKLLGEVSRG